MAKFIYVAKNQEGEVQNGEMEASEEREVVEALRKDDFWPTTITKKKEQKKTKTSIMNSFMSVPLKNRMIFCRHLGVMINSGLSLSKALVILSSQEKNKTFKTVILKLAVDVKKGNTFADAMAKYPKVFGPVFVSMVRMGELSGNLEEILNILADQLEKDHKLISKVRGAMIYPSVIISVMLVIGVLMMIFVVPKLTSMFDEFGADLPIMTRILITVSDFMEANAAFVIGGMIAFVIGVRMFAKSPPGKKIFHKVFIKAPILGGIITKVNSARFSRILSSLLDSGTSLVESLRITSDTLGNHYFKKVVKRASEDVQKGVNLSEILQKNSDIFPYLVIQMIEVGEETGKTPEVLKNLAEFYEEEVDQITKNMSSIIEPVLMVIIGSAVGLFAMAIIQPIYSLMEKM
ncbi:MAG: type II secretion system F family protein [Patescibacteria group bacterium]|nr:type II secretion system F family protein [Patescibacteria group bacterium]